MTKEILNSKDFKKWVSNISTKYKQSQIKAARKVNNEMISFYYDLGKEIASTSFKATYGSNFYNKLSQELISNLPNVRGLSPINLRYMEKFYTIYNSIIQNVPQVVEKLFSIPWGHHRYIIDKCKDVDEALFFVDKVHENNWSRNVLLTFLDTNLYKREAKAITNFKDRLPDITSDLAQQITKDPYCFDFLSIRQNFDEKELKDALVDNIQKFLIELGTGFAYMGREYRLEIGDAEEYLDMLFYNTHIHSYVVVEVKTSDFKPSDIGQLGTYVVAVDHILKSEKDEKTVGLLVCKNKNEFLARYALESSTQPLGISSFELSNIIPENFKGSLPTVEEIENELNDNRDFREDIQKLEKEGDIPNKETKEALAEYKEMKENKEKYKRYNSFSDIANDK